MFFKRVYKRCLVLLVSGLFASTALAIPDDNATVDVVESEWEGEVTLTIPMILLGDVNGDGLVTMADANAVVNYFLSADPSSITNFDVTAADVNMDGGITMADANAIVNMFLGQ